MFPIRKDIEFFKGSIDAFCNILNIRKFAFCKFAFLFLEAKKSRHIFFAQIEGTSRRSRESSTREHFHQLVPPPTHKHKENLCPFSLYLMFSPACHT